MPLHERGGRASGDLAPQRKRARDSELAEPAARSGCLLGLRLSSRRLLCRARRHVVVFLALGFSLVTNIRHIACSLKPFLFLCLKTLRQKLFSHYLASQKIGRSSFSRRKMRKPPGFRRLVCPLHIRCAVLPAEQSDQNLDSRKAVLEPCRQRSAASSPRPYCAR